MDLSQPNEVIKDRIILEAKGLLNIRRDARSR